MAVDDEYKNHICFPSKELIFSAFNQFDFENLKVVIIGQDPYHGEGEANRIRRVSPALRRRHKQYRKGFRHRSSRGLRRRPKVVWF